MDSLVESVEALTGSLKGRIVLDIGCNDGSLLDRFSAKGAKTLGVEPTGAHSMQKDVSTSSSMNSFLNQLRNRSLT
jgi:cyclopropane fatty-acyl-phospholipid synthase-like methyltransferase